MPHDRNAGRAFGSGKCRFAPCGEIGIEGDFPEGNNDAHTA